MARNGSDRWFREGHKAFCELFPGASASIGFASFYVCPQCLVAYSEEALSMKLLTREDVPPKKVGGRPMVLTCKPCNNGNGHRSEDHMRREAELVGFAAGSVDDLKVVMKTARGRAKATLSADPSGVAMRVARNAVHPDELAGVMADFANASQGENWKEFGFNLTLPEFHRERARTGWLRAGYLAFFARFGYRWIWRPELDVVRARLAEPQQPNPPVFRLLLKERADPRLVLVEEPTALRGFAMFYGHWLVLFPGHGDIDFYARLASRPILPSGFRGKDLGWPNGPMYGR